MGDMGELFNDMRKAGQEKRAANRKNAPELLQEAGIAFVSKNGGAHLIVETPSGKIDFWPGTGLWKVRNSKSKRTQRGVFRLIEHVTGSHP